MCDRKGEFANPNEFVQQIWNVNFTKFTLGFTTKKYFSARKPVFISSINQTPIFVSDKINRYLDKSCFISESIQRYKKCS